jgi:hypothetical protein
MRWITWAALALACAGCADKAKGAGGGQDRLRQRAGLWETRLTSGFHGASSVVRVCVDSERDRRLAAAAVAKGAGQCKGLGELTRQGDHWITHTVCKAGGGMTTEMTGTITGDLSSRYTTRYVQTMTPPPVPEMARSESSTEDRWLGPCPADMPPGASEVGGKRIAPRGE